ncbi:MAG: hypothetical protein Aureis2KO_01680 [Aureisphaera sp.]
MKRYLVQIIVFLAFASYGQNHSLEFDGNDDYVSLGDRFDFGLEDSFTVEAWIKTGPSSVQQIISKIGSESDSPYRGWGFQVVSKGVISGYLSFIWDSNIYFTEGSTPINDNNWHHVAMTYNGSEIQLFVDGLDDNTIWWNTGILETINTSGESRIGALDLAPSAAENFSGSIDEVRIWEVARTPEQIADFYDTELSGNEPDLIAYYKMDRIDSPCDIEDCSVNQWHGDRNGSEGQLPQFADDYPSLANVICGTDISCSLSIENFIDEAKPIFASNPVEDVLILNPDIRIDYLEIYSIDGKHLFRSFDSEIDVSFLKSGKYLIRIFANGNSLIKTLIKK